MAWRALTQNDIQTAITGVELNAAVSVVLASGQPSPLAQVIQAVTDEVRGYIAGSVSITLGAEGTIPDKLINAATDMAVYYLTKRIPGKVLATDGRRAAYDDAMRKLRDVAANRLRIEAPTTVTPEQIAIPQPTISSGPIECTRHMEDGI